MDSGDAPPPIPPPTNPPPANDAADLTDAPAAARMPPVHLWSPLPHVPPPVPAAEEDQHSQSTDDDDDDDEDDDDDDNDNDQSEHDHEDEDSDEDEESETHWLDITEDASEPSADERQWIADHPERYHSALDHEHWEKQAFFHLNDPAFETIECGRIEWHVEAFNGTKEKPNTELIMRSQIVKIAGLDWQMKFYPKGKRDSNYLCVYIDCISMLSPEWEDLEEVVDPPFPVFEGDPKVKKRRSVAAQIAVLMYNPAEPRVNEFQTEAHNYHKRAPDYGWKYFTQEQRQRFHHRQQFQPQAILRNDKLSFTAYIRVVRDPTHCLWEHEERSSKHFTSLHGLRPFSRSFPYIAATVPLLHYGPFRKLVQQLNPGAPLAQWLHNVLFKMYSRAQSVHFSAHLGIRGRDDRDVAEILWKLALSIREQFPGGEEYNAFAKLVGTFNPEDAAAIGPGRLNTKDYPSIQLAVNKHHALTPLAQPELLTLELQRQEHDKKDRKWKKITNRVEVEERIVVGDVSYLLYAFVTHSGPLHSPEYSTYLRPRGVAGGWYTYQKGKVFKVTEQQAKHKHTGASSAGHDSPLSDFHEASSEVSSLVMYMREDAAFKLDTSAIEAWSKPPVPESESLEARLEKATSFSSPESARLDGEDVVMKDVDDTSEFGGDEDDPAAIGGTVDWLGRPYYEGNWKDKVYHGGGNLITLDGNEYLGEFKDGMKHGYGKMTYSISGDIYDGDWADDKPHGQGKLTEKSSGNVYEGGFNEGQKHGKFVLSGTVTDEDKSCCSICYTAELNMAFYPCGHVLACEGCASKVDICPTCRTPVQSRLKLFGVKVSIS